MGDDQNLILVENEHPQRPTEQEDVAGVSETKSISAAGSKNARLGRAFPCVLTKIEKDVYIMPEKRKFVNSYSDKPHKNTTLSGTSFLSEWLNDPETQNQLNKLVGYKKDGTPVYKGELRYTFNERFACTKLLQRKGYKSVPVENDDGVTKMQSGDSVAIIYPATGFNQETVLLSNYTKGNMDGFALFSHLFCNGDAKAAMVAAKKSLGMWE